MLPAPRPRSRLSGDSGAVASGVVEIAVVLFAAMVLAAGTGFASVRALERSWSATTAHHSLVLADAALSAAWTQPNGDGTRGFGGLDPTSLSTTRTDVLISKLRDAEPSIRWSELENWDYATAEPGDVWVHLHEGCAAACPEAAAVSAAAMVTVGGRSSDGSTVCLARVAAAAAGSAALLGAGYMTVATVDSAKEAPAAVQPVEIVRGGWSSASPPAPVDRRATTTYRWQGIANCAAPGDSTLDAAGLHFVPGQRLPGHANSVLDDGPLRPAPLSQY